jgi:hypothetical protein
MVSDSSALPRRFVLGVLAAPHRTLQRDQAPLVGVRQGLIHRLHPKLLLAHLHRGVDLVDLVLADQVPDRRVRYHDLQRHGAPWTVGSRQQRLAQHALQHEGQLRADLRLLVGRKDIDDPVDRLHRRVGVQRRQAEVARLGHGQRRLDRLEVPHLADQDDVRVLPQNVFESLLEVLGVRTHLALIHHTSLVLVQVLDRILDRHDVLVPIVVDLVDHRRQRGGLAGPGRARHQDQAPGTFRQFGDDLRQPQLFEAHDLEWNGAKRPRHVPPLHEDVRAEAGELLHAEREVELVGLLELMLLGIRQDGVAELLGFGRRHRRHAQGMKLPVDAQLGRRPRRDVEIARSLLDHRLQELVHICHLDETPIDPPPTLGIPL